MKISPETLARASSRHAWRTVAVWAVILVLGFGASGVLLSNALTTDFDFTNNPEAIRAQTLLQQKQLEQDVTPETFVMTGSQGATTDPDFTAKVNAALNDLRALDKTVVLHVPSAYPLSKQDASNPQVAALGPFPSQDGTAVLFNVILAKDSEKTATIVDPLDAIQAKYTTGDTQFYMLGEPTSTADFKKISEDDLKKGETIGVVVAIVVLLIVFGSLIAGVTPIIMGIFAIGVAFGIVGLLGAVWRWSFFVPNLITMLGLAVGIDYSLFIVSRYREERRRGRDNLEAIGMSGATANRAVFFSGFTVVIALAGMLLVPTTIFRGLAGGAIIVVLISVALSMTLLPALMALFSDRLVKPGFIFGRGRTLEQGRAGGFWDRESRSVMKRPWVYLIVTASFMILLSVPYWTQSRADGVGHGMKKGFSGIAAIPDGIPTKDAFNVLVAKFPTESGAQSTAQVVIPGSKTDPSVAQKIQALDAAIANDGAFATPQPPQTSQDGTVTLVSIPFAGEATDSQSAAAVDAITRLRDEYVPQAFGQDSGVLVGGDTAMTKDFFDISNFYTPIIILLVLGLSFILLTVVFRSIVVPAKAIVMNLLSVGAAYGLITLIFQQGGPAWAHSIANALNFTQVDAIESWLPLFLFSILFGLSMDYQVFLLSRIREEYDKSGDNSEAVAYGLRTTGGIITGAAVIMVAVFAAFASGRIAALQEMGFGLAVAVFLDATIVRSILVPSAMKLLGDRNWYLPGWLQWLPKVDVEGHAAAERITIPDTPAELVEARDSSD
ncbi:MAG: MMPL family transporter [Actinobacteria bacterium]|nr:MAG: MMPL family transporter [Actinomycetota bacterium]TMK93131.1 MAG: MMPL family transporter [Actinomycetota bacterium]